MDLELLTAELRKAGYRIWAFDDGREWRVTLNCGVDVLDGRLPRPHGSGRTLLAALQAAVVCKNELVKGLKGGA
jgi:hypothetical protein